MSAQRRLSDRAIYWICSTLVRILATIFYRLRVYGGSRTPATGPLLIVANHQSYLDPPLIGVAVTSRSVHFLARSGLFKNRAFGRLITALNSVPIREESGDIGAIREVVARVNDGAALLLFPEGSRSPDGEIGEFKRGVALVVRKADCPVVPAAIEGAFDAWPRHRPLPRLWGRRVAVMFGQPIPAEELFRDGPDAALARLRAEVESMRTRLRRSLDSSAGLARSGPAPRDDAFGG